MNADTLPRDGSAPRRPRTGPLLLAAALLLGGTGRAGATERVVALDPAADAVGRQVYTVQAYTPAGGGPTVVDIGLYDTGASVVSYSWYANPFFPQPHLAPGGAGGAGIGGSVTGDVSRPGAILAGGFQDFTIDFTTFQVGVATDPARAVPGIQAFVGSLAGSPALPTLTGTPIHKPSAAFPGGSAARIAMRGLDFGTSFGLPEPLFMPSFDLVAPGTAVTPRAGSTAPVRVPLGRFGADTYAAPGSGVSAAENPTVEGVTFTHAAGGGAPLSVGGETLLFDTGAQVSLISTTLAANLGLDVTAPETALRVQGAAGTPLSLPGFTIDAVTLAAAVDGEAFDDVLRFTDVPVFVLDLGIPGLDGILGMNVFNTADELVFDPINDEFGVSFLAVPEAGDGDLGTVLAALLGGQYSVFAGHVAPAFGLGPVAAVPEPAGVVLAGVVIAAGAIARARRRR